MFCEGLSPEIKNILQHIHKMDAHHDEDGVGIFSECPYQSHDIISLQYKIYTQDEIDPLHEIPVRGVVKYSIARTGQDKVVVKRFQGRNAAFMASVDLLKQHQYVFAYQHGSITVTYMLV
jgi:hypothetical protein